MYHRYNYKILNIIDCELITIEEIKNYARITNEQDDDLIKAMIESAINIAENYLKLQLIDKEIEVTFSRNKQVVLPFVPISRITKIILDDVEMDISKLSIQDNRINFNKYHNKIIVHYIAGFEDKKFIPKAILEGIKLHIASMYDTRGSALLPNPEIIAIYQPFRNITF